MLINILQSCNIFCFHSGIEASYRRLRWGRGGPSVPSLEDLYLNSNHFLPDAVSSKAAVPMARSLTTLMMGNRTMEKAITVCIYIDENL